MADADPNCTGWEEWRRRRAQRSWRLLGAAGLLLGTGVVPLLIHRRLVAVMARHPDVAAEADATHALDLLATFAVASVVLTSLLATLFLLTVARRRRVDRCVAANDGSICPWCAAVMVDAPDMPPPTHIDERALRCRDCAAHATLGETRRYWEQLVWSPHWAVAWRRRHAGRSNRLGRRVAAAIEAIRRRRAARVSCAIVWATAAAAIFALAMGAGGASPLEATLRAAPVTIALIVVSIVLAARRDRSTADPDHEQVRCRGCGYPRTAPLAEPTRCPECGSDWWRVGGAIVGAYAPSRRRIGLAIGLMLVLVGLSVAGPHLLRAAYPIMPNAVLVRLLGATRHDDDRILLLLDARQPGDAIRDAINVRLVEVMEGSERVSPAVVAWLERSLSVGALAIPDVGDQPTLADRFAAAWATGWIDGPHSAVPGAAVTLNVGGAPRHDPFTALEPLFIWGGWYVDGHGPDGRGATFDRMEAIYFTGRRGVHSRTTGPPRLVFRPRAAGRVVVTGDLWIVLERTEAMPRVEWDAAGEPIWPDGRPGAVGRIRLRHEIRVE